MHIFVQAKGDPQCGGNPNETIGCAENWAGEECCLFHCCEEAAGEVVGKNWAQNLGVPNYRLCPRLEYN